MVGTDVCRQEDTKQRQADGGEQKGRQAGKEQWVESGQGGEGEKVGKGERTR